MTDLNCSAFPALLMHCNCSSSYDDKERKWRCGDIEMQKHVVHSISAFLGCISAYTCQHPLVNIHLGSSSFILVEKLKILKFNLKRQNKEVLCNVVVGKNLALYQVGFWDSKERMRALYQEEVVAMVESRVGYRKWAPMKEMS
ncbi:hypothetical protein CK203_096547 [Vitis vinifera]|uniref:Uncharacterized protein n=1 Tax=Vitis vinifera TaxID=29760 RepID=A0A438E3H1_VITVI|nr:hypothetical protein CK203_096547 [Vitis vinifera]